MNPGRRRALRVLAGTGAATRPPAAPVRAARRAEAGPPDAVGHALRHDPVHRLQGVRRRLPRGERARAGHEPRRAAPGAARPQRADEERHQALQGRASASPTSRRSACTASTRPAPAPACCARSRRTRRPGSSATTRSTASAAATARWPARSTSRSSSARRPRPKIVKCELCRHRLAQGRIPACCESARARPSSTASAPSCSPRRSGGSRRTRTRYVPQVYGETEAAARRCCTSRTCRSRSSGCPTRAAGRARTRRTRSRTASTGLRRAGRALRRPRRRALAQPHPGGQAGGGEAMSSHAHPHAPVGGALWTRPFRILVARPAARRRHALWRFAPGLAAVEQPERRLPVGHLDRLRRRRRAPPSAAAATPWRSSSTSSTRASTTRSCARRCSRARSATAWRARGDDRPRAAVGALEGAGLLLALEPLAAARGRAVRHDLRRRALVELSPAAFEKWQDEPGGPARVRPVRACALVGQGDAVHPRPRPAAADDAPVLARDHDAAARAAAAPAVVTPLAAAPVPRQLRADGLRRRRARVHALGGRLRPASARRPMLASLGRVGASWSCSSWPSGCRDLALRGSAADPRPPGYAWLSRSSWACSSPRALVLLPRRARRRNAGPAVLPGLLLMVGRRRLPLQRLPRGLPARAHWSYFPAVPELLITFGIVALEIALYVAVVRTSRSSPAEPAPARA